MKPEHRIRVVNPPSNYDETMSGYRIAHRVTSGRGEIDMAHVFVGSQAELRDWLPRLRNQLVDNGVIWVSWPKMSSEIRADVNETKIRECALGIDLVDVKVCAVSDIWSGLKLVIPVAKRSLPKRP